MCNDCGHDNVANGICQEEVDIESLSPMEIVELCREIWDDDILRCGCKCVLTPIADDVLSTTGVY